MNNEPLIIENEPIPRTIFGVKHTEKNERKIKFNVCKIYPTQKEAEYEYTKLLEYPTLYLDVKKIKYHMNASDWEEL